MAKANVIVNVTSKMYSAKIWKDLRFPDIKTSEDDYTFIDILKRCDRYYATKETVYCRTMSEVSLTRSNPVSTLINASATRLRSIDYIIDW